MCPMGLHQDPKATRCSVETTENATVYIDEILILAGSRKLAREHVIGLIYLLENLGFVISKPKCVLEPIQSIEFLGFSVNSVHDTRFSKLPILLSMKVLHLRIYDFV